MTGVTRLSVVVGSTLAIVLVLANPTARADDLDDLLERADDATYTATRLTVSVWDDTTNVVRERVEHANGAEMIRVDRTWSMVGNGRTIVLGDSPEGIAFMPRSAPIVSDRYEVADEAPCTHLRRACRFYTILEDEAVRARMLIDTKTGAPLITYVYDGDGATYRTISLSDFAPHRTYEWPEGSVDAPLEIVMHDEPTTAPEAVGGYRLVDAFDGPAGSEQAFYSDGLFSFSLFVMSEDTSVEGFEDPRTLETDRGTYDLLTTARDVRVHWSDGDHHYVVVGDLPPDHLETVLDELPRPGTASIFTRIWRALFG